MVNLFAPDLTQHPPRSPRVRLGGYAHLPRLIDKARAFAAGKNGDYNYNCTLDRMFFEFAGLSHEAFLDEVKKVRAALGGTVNDVVLAVVAGALRSLLLGRKERIDGPLRVMVPVSVRPPEERGTLGNQVAAIFCPLPVHEPDPLIRLMPGT